MIVAIGDQMEVVQNSDIDAQLYGFLAPALVPSCEGGV